MIRSNFDQGSEAWHDARLGRITGTRFAPLMMGETTQGYNSLIAEVAAEILTKESDSNFVSDMMKRGTDMEAEARSHAEQLLGDIEETGFMIPDEGHVFHDYVGISPDGIVTSENVFIEIKCPMLKTHFGYIRTDDPSEYRWQLQGGLWISGNPHTWFYSYYPNVTPYLLKVLPNEKDFKMIDARLPIFIEQVSELIEKYEKMEL